MYWITVGPDRRELFMGIFGRDSVPVKDLNPRLCALPIGIRPCYMLDWRRLGCAAHDRLLSHLARSFGCSVGEVERTLAAEGLPLLAEGCTPASTEEQKYL